MTVVDDMKRICYLHWGFSASASDKRVQRSMRVHTDPDDYFDHVEYVLGDSGFTCTCHIIAMFTRLRGEADLQGRPVSTSLRLER